MSAMEDGIVENVLENLRIVNTVEGLGFASADFSHITKVVRRLAKVSSTFQHSKYYTKLPCGAKIWFRLGNEGVEFGNLRARHVSDFIEIGNIKFLPSIPIKIMSHINNLIEDDDFKLVGSHRTDYDLFTDDNTVHIIRDAEDFRLKIRNKLLKYAQEKKVTFSRESLPAIAWLIGKNVGNSLMGDFHFTEIFYVHEEHNIRYAFFFGEGNYYIQSFNTDNPYYNYADKGRLIYEDTLWLYNIDEPDNDVLERIVRDSPKPQILDPPSYQKFAQKYRLELLKKRHEQELEEKMENALRQRINELDKHPITANNITFSADQIVMQDQKLKILKIKSHKTEGVFDLHHFIKSYVDFKHPDFNEIFINLVDTIFGRDYDNCCNVTMCGFEAIFGNVKVNYEQVKKEYQNDKTAVYHYVNGMRINKDDIVELIKRAICFNSTDDFNGLADEISRCSLKIHDILNKGIKFTFSTFKEHQDYQGTDRYATFQIVRKGRKHHVKFADKLLPIKSINAFYTKANPKADRFKMNTITFAKYLSDQFKITTMESAQLLHDGLAEYDKAIERSKQLLRHTLKLLGIKSGEFTIQGSKYEGWLVKGNLGQYFLTKDCKIFTYPDGQYCCVVDKSIGKQVGYDMIVNRLYALHNDKFVVNEVTTLRRGN